MCGQCINESVFCSFSDPPKQIIAKKIPKTKVKLDPSLLALCTEISSPATKTIDVNTEEISKQEKSS